MDLDYRRIGGKGGGDYDDFEMALTVLTTVISVPTREMAMVDGGLKAFSTDKPFVPEAVECPGVTYSWAGDEHGRLTVSEEGRLPALGQLIEFFPPHCDPTINLYDRIYAMRGQTGRSRLGHRRPRPLAVAEHPQRDRFDASPPIWQRWSHEDVA